MAQLDHYARSIARFNAEAVLMRSEDHVSLRFADGDRVASQYTSHAELQALVREVVPQQIAELLDDGLRTCFEHRVNGSRFAVDVAPSEDQWEVTITPLPADRNSLEKPTEPAEPEPYRPGLTPQAGIPSIDRRRITRAVSAMPPPSQPTLPSLPSAPPRVRTEHSLSSAPSLATVISSPSSSSPSPATAISSPAQPDSRRDMERLLASAQALGASDLLVCSGVPPTVRVDGSLSPLPNWPPLDAKALLAMLLAVTPERERAVYVERNDAEFAFSFSTSARYRAKLFRDRNGPGAVFRIVPAMPLFPRDLGLPASVLDMCFRKSGLLLVTGSAGSGKSTTLATLVDHMNLHHGRRIVIIEECTEFVHEPKGCLVSQRKVPAPTVKNAMADAIRAAIDEHPDVLVLGELRSPEAMTLAIQAAADGHLVVATMPAMNVRAAVDRLIEQSEPALRDSVRTMLADSLCGVVAQTLCKKIGGGRVAAYEVLHGTSSSAALIRERRTLELPSLMHASRAQGMSTLDESLLELIRMGVVEKEEALSRSIHRAELRARLEPEAKRSGVGAGK